MADIEDLGEVISTDVLIIGGGISGVVAAIKAREYPVDVLIVDKATVGWAGQATKSGNGLWIMGPDDEIVFAGDILFNDCHPYMGHGFVKEWLSYLDFINELNPSAVVPGHGKISNINDLFVMKDYLTTLNDIADKMIREGKTEDDIPDILIPGKYKNWLFDRFFTYNLNFLLSENK